MRLADAVNAYVEIRRHSGSPFHSSERTLRAFCRYCGEIELDGVTAHLVSTFSNNPACVPATRVSKFSGVKCFLDYYSVRGHIPFLPLCRPAKPKTLRVPFIYTKAEIASLLRSTTACQANASGIDAKTLRLVVLLLYATGATIQEILALKWSAIDLKRRCIVIEKTILRASRTLPIAPEFARYLGRRRAECRSLCKGCPVLRGTDGNALNEANLKERFVRLRQLAGIRLSEDGRVPRLIDLRFTFAVHRLNAWVRHGDDLNRLIPALSTYMGYRSLTDAEQFLAYVPNRFKQELKQLSPLKGRKRWRSDPTLMAFLSSL